MMKFIFALWVGKIVNILANIVDKKRGSNIAGRIAMKFDKQMVRHFKNVDPEKTLFITGTNGKSTTNNLVNHIITYNGLTVVSNLEGANLLTGIATGLLKKSDLLGRMHADYFVFEVDERSLPIIYKQLPAKNILITNLQKDQAQRNGDPDFIWSKLRPIMADQSIRLFLNNEEPRSRAFAVGHEKVVTYGAEKHNEAFTKGATFPTLGCPLCHRKVEFDFYNNDGVGTFHCTHCDNKSASKADYISTDADFEKRTFKVNGVDFTMPYDVPYMLYNYASAAAVCKEIMGIEIEDTAKAFSSFKNIDGRYVTLSYKDKTIKYLRIKQENPDTLQNSINIMAADPNEKLVCLGYGRIDDHIPFFTESFYTFDCDYTALINGNVEKFFCFSRTLVYDIAKQLEYFGADTNKLIVKDTEEVEDIFEVIDNSKAKVVYIICTLHNYDEIRKKVQMVEKEAN